MVRQHIRYALRSFRRNPLLVVVAVLSLSLGIGANTAIFSLIDQLLLRSLPVRDPQQLVQLAARGAHPGSNWGMNAMSYPMYRDIRDKAEVFNGVMCRFSMPLSLGHQGQTERIRGELVSGNYFDVLGVPAAIGRTFTPDDDQKPNAHPLVMLTYDFWQRRFGADPRILGQTLHINSYPMTVIGVSRRGFQGVEHGDATQVFVPMMMQQKALPMMSMHYKMEDRRTRFVNTFARLKPGVTIAQAKAALEPLYKQIIRMEVTEAFFKDTTEFSRKRFLESRMEVLEGATGRSYLRRQFTTPLYVLLAITGLVLLIACANVSNLLIARATARQREIAVRMALGASRGQIVAQLFTESLLLAAFSVAAGLVIGRQLVAALLRFASFEMSAPTIQAAFDMRILAFSIGLGLLTCLLFGVVPALQASRPDVASTLKDEAGGVIGGAHRIRRALVVAQVSLSLLLLIGSGLFIRSLANLRLLDPGFRIERIVSFSVDPPLNGYNPGRTLAFYRDLLAGLRAAGGVEHASNSVMRVLDGDEWDSSVTVEGYQAKQGEDMNPHMNAVSPDYFATLGIPLVAGRDFTDHDERNSTKTCIVNQTFARKYFPNGDAVGRHIGMGDNPGTKTDIEIVGVVGDAKYENMRDVVPRQVFRPIAQLDGIPGTVIYVRTTLDSSQAFTAARAIVRNLDANLPLFEMRTLEEQVDLSLVTERMIATLFERVRRRGHTARGGRALRRHGVYRGPPCARNRHPHGAWRAAGRRPAPGDARHRVADRAGSAHRLACLLRAVALCAVATVRSDAQRHHHCGGRERCPLRRRVAGGLLARSTCFASRSDERAALRVVVKEVEPVVELLQCASLIVDDLPCMDDADWRRSRPAVHVASLDLALRGHSREQ